MNLSNPFPPKLPQIVPKPDFPVPEVSYLAKELSYLTFQRISAVRKTNRVLSIMKSAYQGSILFMQDQIIAIYLYQPANKIQSRYALFLTEPEDSKLIPRKSLFDRFNALLLRKNLPTLYLVGKNYWIFSDGMPWTGRRTLFFPKEKSASRSSEKMILQNILKLPPSL